MATIPQLREIGLPKGMGSSSLAATIASLMLEGFYICLFIVTMLFLYQKGVPMRSLSVVLIVIIFICNLADAAMDIFTAFQGFVAFRQGPDIYYTLFNTKQVDNSWYAAGE
ncbi:hypothetical protein FRB98_008794 [Tulasnella sp. 332]|nr:hypothetical protein FRB98_008794 [Tulasnella sp. 332]